jgi:hypothetical protein
VNPDEIRYQMESELAWADFYDTQAAKSTHDTGYAAKCREEAQDARQKAREHKARLDACEAQGGTGTG